MHVSYGRLSERQRHERGAQASSYFVCYEEANLMINYLSIGSSPIPTILKSSLLLHRPRVPKYPPMIRM